MKNERITICPNCGEPLVWTFINSGSEWYCINCKNDYPMFGAKTIYKDEEDKKKFEYLKRKQKIYKSIFKAIEKDIIPYSAYKKNCKKCNGMKEKHYQHLSNTEKIKDEISREILERINFTIFVCEEECIR